MTTYHGGKQRIGEKLARVIYDESVDIAKLKSDEDFKIKGYCEPFCGMLGVYQHIPKLFKDQLKYKAGDQNKSVVMMWQQAQKGWEPPTTCTEERFYKLKSDGKSTAEKGFIGHLCSFRSIYFGGYAYHITKKRMENTSTKVQKIATELKKVKFSNGSYTQFSNLKDYVIYCDPPYANTTQNYRNEQGRLVGFDTYEFWDWCDKMAANNIVFVSGYGQVSDAELIYTNKKEKLYLFR